MSNYQISAESTQSSDIIHWLLETLWVVNSGGKLVPEKAITKTSLDLVDAYGTERVFEGIKQLSLTFRRDDISSVEALFHSHPDLPELLKTDHEAHKALNEWFEQHSRFVTRFHKISSAILRMDPAIECNVEPLSDANEDFKPIMDILFHDAEGIK